MKKRVNDIRYFTAIFSIVLAIGVAGEGKWTDCAPGIHDQWCGVSTGLGLVAALVLLVLINGLGAITLLFLRRRWEKQEQLEDSQPLSDVAQLLPRSVRNRDHGQT